MADPTAARDRAIVKGVEGALFVADEPGATEVERVLAAEVHRLRALAGPPTADVTSFVADTESRLPGLREPDPLSDWSKGVVWVLDRARAFAANPEGVDAADEQHVAKCASCGHEHLPLDAKRQDNLPDACNSILTVNASRIVRCACAIDVLSALDGDTTEEG